jgi:hypothetical protein
VAEKAPDLFEGYLLFSGSVTMAGLAILTWIVIRLSRKTSALSNSIESLTEVSVPEELPDEP